MLPKSIKTKNLFWKFLPSTKKKTSPIKTFLKYNLRFTSIISPGSVTNLRLMQLGTHAPKTHHNKLIVKQSYLLLTWLTYIQTSSNSKGSSKSPSFFIQPKKQSKFTHLKAPMAHKTFSQEQFIFKHYVIVISFRTQISEKETLDSVNDSIFVILALRNSIPFFNTNLLFLKRMSFTLSSKDNSFMKLY